MTNAPYDDEDYGDPYDGYDDDFCDHGDPDIDILEGRARCLQCGHSWYLTEEQLTREIRFFASMIECIEEEAP